MKRLAAISRLSGLRRIPFSLCFIALAGIVTLVPYLFMPDNSPGAERAFPKLALRPAGSTQQYLSIPIKAPKRSVAERLILAKPPAEQLLPIHSYFLDKERLAALEYISPRVHRLRYFSLKSLLPASQHKRQLGSRQRYVLEHNIVRRKALLGTDSRGRDLLSRFILGTRGTLVVALLSALIAAIIGLPLGLLAGYSRRLTAFSEYVLNLFTAIPAPIIAGASLLLFKPSFATAVLAIGLGLAVRVANAARREIELAFSLPYINQTHAARLPHGHLLRQYLLPQVARPFAKIALAAAAEAILLESGLSAIGLNASGGVLSWGRLLREYVAGPSAPGLLPLVVIGVAITLLAAAFYTVARRVGRTKEK